MYKHNKNVNIKKKVKFKYCLTDLHSIRTMPITCFFFFYKISQITVKI